MDVGFTREYKLSILGGGGVGKSCLTLKMIGNNFVEEYDPTIEDFYTYDCEVDGEKARLLIIDSAGQEEYKAIQEQYIITGEGFMLVFSLEDRRSYDEVTDLVNLIFRIKEKKNVPIIIVGNKSDLEKRDISFEEANNFAKSNRISYIETSAKEDINVKEAFYDLVRLIHNQDSNKPSPIQMFPDQKLEDDGQKEKRGCMGLCSVM